MRHLIFGLLLVLLLPLSACSGLYGFDGFKIRQPCDGPCSDARRGSDALSSDAADGGLGTDGSPGEDAWAPPQDVSPEDRPQSADVLAADAQPDAPEDGAPPSEDAPGDAFVTADVLDAAVTPDTPDAGPGDVPMTDRELLVDAPVRTDTRPDSAAPDVAPPDVLLPDVAPPDAGPALPRDPVERARYCAALTGCLDCMRVRFSDDTGCAWCTTGLRSGHCQYGTPTGPSSFAGVCEATELHWLWGYCI